MATQQEVIDNLIHSCLVVNGKMHEVGYRVVTNETGVPVDIEPYFRAEDQTEASLLPEMSWTLQ